MGGALLDSFVDSSHCRGPRPEACVDLFHRLRSTCHVDIHRCWRVSGAHVKQKPRIPIPTLATRFVGWWAAQRLRSACVCIRACTCACACACACSSPSSPESQSADQLRAGRNWLRQLAFLSLLDMVGPAPSNAKPIELNSNSVTT